MREGLGAGVILNVNQKCVILNGVKDPIRLNMIEPPAVDYARLDRMLRARTMSTALSMTRTRVSS
jgi:hypothetical protein